MRTHTPRVARTIGRNLAKVLWGVALAVLGAFAVTFSVANYPWFAALAVLALLAAIAVSERSRRRRRAVRERLRAGARNR